MCSLFTSQSTNWSHVKLADICLQCLLSLLSLEWCVLYIQKAMSGKPQYPTWMFFTFRFIINYCTLQWLMTLFQCCFFLYEITTDSTIEMLSRWCPWTNTNKIFRWFIFAVSWKEDLTPITLWIWIQSNKASIALIWPVYLWMISICSICSSVLLFHTQ